MIAPRLLLAAAVRLAIATPLACSSVPGGSGVTASGGTSAVAGGSSEGGGLGQAGSREQGTRPIGGGDATGSGASAGAAADEWTDGGGAAVAGSAQGAGGTRRTDGAAGTGGAIGLDAGKGMGGALGRAGSKSTGGATGTDSGKGTAAAGTGGSASICGVAAEGASAALTCPQGQIIDSVVFASYGTPSGTCGDFAAGSCNSTSSETVVQSQCVGHTGCTVAAANETFGDPCHNTTKKLAVEVSCAVGDSTSTTPQSPYKGIANSPASQITALGASWCYNWKTKPEATDCNDPYFVPMVWGSGDVAGAIKAIGNAGYTTVLGFNEPNKSDQANMSVDSAIALWPQMTSNPNIRVGSPAVSDDGRSWLEDFMTKAQAKSLRVDFIAMHWYGWNAGSCVASQLEGAVKWASKWSLPVWITEFGCMGSSNPDEKTVLNFFNSAIPMLNSYPRVERYAWYPWNTYNHLYDSNTMTALGQAFAAAPQYRQ